ncbi:Leucine-rich repeat neuronal protein 3 [Labeo rohita]|uniref:Leucine-rich repeat neuronal protein 3 n=1 Tax=Labeo rohita TaxID=84645 RepID=A0ABQ8LAM4_LABRO|nr:Leucine-rich repeat neuronal protein 3 [Labeo rohita]
MLCITGILVLFIYFIDVLICCEAAVSDLLTDLGSNVIINCDLDENDVYWILLKTPDPPTVILRSVSTPTSPFYYNNTFRKKYSVQFKHGLVINNVTANELGVYYCMKTGAPPKLSNSTRLHFNDTCKNKIILIKYIISVFLVLQMCSYSNRLLSLSLQNQLKTECHNHTVVEFIDQNQTQWQIIVIISSLMNGLLLILLIGLLNVFVGNRRSAEQSQLSTTASTAASYRNTSGPFTF